MKKALWTISAVALVAAIAIGASGTMRVFAADDKPMFRHVVLFKFKDGTSDADIKKVQRAFLDLKKGIDVIRDVESGKDQSTENLQQGFTHAFIVTFDDAKARDTYLVHPVHKEFVKLAGPFLDKALVVDFVPER